MKLPYLTCISLPLFLISVKKTLPSSQLLPQQTWELPLTSPQPFHYPVDQMTKPSITLVVVFRPTCHYLGLSHYSLKDCFLPTVFHASDFCTIVIFLKCKSNLMMLPLKIFQLLLSSQKLIPAHDIPGLHETFLGIYISGTPEKALFSSPNHSPEFAS